MASRAELALILSLVDEVSKSADDIKGRLGGLGREGSGAQGVLSDLGKIGKGVLATGLGVAAAAAGTLAGVLATTIGPASDLSETVSKTSVVFGDYGAAVLEWGESAATALGMSKNEALGAAATYGNLFRSMGMAEDASSGMSTEIVELAADLASFNNLETTDVLDKLRAGLTGESEPLKQLGININETILKNRALAMGFEVGKGPLDALTKSQAAYAEIMAQTGLAQGDFARTSEGLANQQRILKASLTDLKAAIGTALIPVVLDLLKPLGYIIQDYGPQLVAWFSDKIAPAISAVSTVIGDFVTYLIEGEEPMAVFRNMAGDLFGEEIGTRIADIVEKIAGFIGMIVEFVSTHAEEFKGALLGIGAVLAGAMIANAVTGIAGAIGALASPVGLIIAAAALLGAAWAGNWGGIQEKTKAVIDFVRPYIEAALAAIRKFWEDHGAQIIAAVTGAWDSVKNLFVAAFDFLKAAVAVALEIIRAFWAEHGDGITRILGNMWEIVKTIFQTAWDVIGGIVRALTAALTGDWETCKNELVGVVTALWDGITGIFALAWDNLKTLVTEMVSGIVNLFSGIDWGTLGKNIIDGIVNGIKNGAQAVWDALMSVVNSAVDAVKKFLGIASPSKLAARAIGEPFVEGIGVGIRQAMDRLAAVELPDMTARLVGVPASGMAAAQAGAPGGNQFHLHIHSSAASEPILSDFALLEAMAGG